MNGGKSDALNTGVALSTSKYVGCIDVDCLLQPDALLHVVKSFFQRSKKRVIAVGGVIRVANSCIIQGGQLEEIRLPSNWLARFQLLEYTRSFILGRMAWGRIDSLLIISGAFGFFEREIALAVGGYDTDTVGEDMEIVFKMRRYMHDRRETVYNRVYSRPSVLDRSSRRSQHSRKPKRSLGQGQFRNVVQA